MPKQNLNMLCWHRVAGKEGSGRMSDKVGVNVNPNLVARFGQRSSESPSHNRKACFRAKQARVVVFPVPGPAITPILLDSE